MISRQDFNKKGLCFILLGLIFLIYSCATVTDFFGLSSPEMAPGLPSRSSRAKAGRAFLTETAKLSPAQRDARIESEIKSGNFPNFLRRTIPIHTQMKLGGKAHFKAIFYVLPDYLAIGNDKDFVRMPMTPMVAQKIADSFGYILPTRKMVDLIYLAAKKIQPRPLPAHSMMTSNDYYLRHQNILDGQISRRSLGQLLAGHKKDIVITNRLFASPYQVAIYGWHLGSGRPIQPLSLVHPNIYADYSHGVRLVHRFMYLNGKKVTVESVLRDKVLSKLLSDEGPLKNTKLQTRPRLSFVREGEVGFGLAGKNAI